MANEKNPRTRSGEFRRRWPRKLEPSLRATPLRCSPAPRDARIAGSGRSGRPSATPVTATAEKASRGSRGNVRARAREQDGVAGPGPPMYRIYGGRERAVQEWKPQRRMGIIAREAMHEAPPLIQA